MDEKLKEHRPNEDNNTAHTKPTVNRVSSSKRLIIKGSQYKPDPTPLAITTKIEDDDDGDNNDTEEPHSHLLHRSSEEDIVISPTPTRSSRISIKNSRVPSVEEMTPETQVKTKSYPSTVPKPGPAPLTKNMENVNKKKI